MKKNLFKVMAMAAVAALTFSCSDNAKSDAKSPAAAGNSSQLIAFVEVDSIMSQYDFCKEMKAQLESKGQNIDNALKGQEQNLQAAVQNFQSKLQNNGFSSRQEAENQQAAIERQQQVIEQAQLQMEQAHLQMQDVIIAQGYDPDKGSQVPADVMHNADVKSGYALSKSQLASARTQLAAAQHELRSGVLTAPFDGVVANVTVQAHQLAQAGKPVCRVIASGDMAVEFRVMETDLCRYQIGTALAIIPVSDQSQQYKATVSEINPVVDPQGAVTLRARLSDTTPLFDGMNVEVVLLKIDN